MNKIREKIINTSFRKACKRFIIAALCVVILGGGASALLLRTQLQEGVTYARQIRQEEKSGTAYDSQKATGDNDKNRKEKEDNRQYSKENLDVESVITKPSRGAKAVVGITGVLCILLCIYFWLFVAAWLYKTAVLAGMHGFLWFLLGLAGNLAAAILFLLVRSFIRKKCDACGSYLPLKAQYCSKCGEALIVKCPQCESICKKGEKYCNHCGKSFGQEK